MDQLFDRRATPRLESDLPARFSDYDYEWEGRCASISVQGCFIESDDLLEEGTELELALSHPDGDELTIHGIVRWAREPTGRLAAGMGIAFDLRERRSIELSTDFVERLALEDIATAPRYRDALRPLPINTVVYWARGAPENPILSDAERTFLAWVDGSRNLRAIRDAVGEETWDWICYTPFSLRGKGLITTEAGLAAPSAPAQRASGGATRAPATSDVRSRNAQAHQHYQRAVEALETNERGRALTELRLAIMLAPGDPEIIELPEELEV